MIDIRKHDTENELEYIWRVCQAKDAGLIDLSWDSIADIFNEELRDEGVEWTSSAYRKPYQSAKEYYDKVFKKMIDDKKYVSELDKQARRIMEEREKLNSTKAEYRKEIKKQSRFELFYENVRRAIESLPVPELEYLPYDENENNYVLAIADIHAGANFNSYYNSYSLEICKNRFETLLNKTIDFVTQNKVGHLTVVELGDSIQGILRISDVKLNETSIVEATVFVSKLIANFLNQLSAYCRIDYYHVPSSNHSQIRPLGTKASELATEDIEYVIFNYVKDVLSENPNIMCFENFGKEYIEINLGKYKMLAMHGHQIKNIETSLKDVSCLHKVFYDCLLLAHYHGSKELSAGESFIHDTDIIIAPSFVGGDPYGDSLMKSSKPACKIYGINDTDGLVETYKILL